MTLRGTKFLAGVFTLALAVLWGGTTRAEESQRLDVPNYRTIDPTVSRTLATPPCPADGLVAFTVQGAAHVSQGGTTLLGYSYTITNTGGGWVPGGGTFIAPCAGLYSFTVTLVKDPYKNDGTSNDVYLYITHNGSNKGYAWAGQTSTAARETGTYTLATTMDAGDYVQTFAGSDGGEKRNIGKYNFTGFLVRRTDTPNP